MQTLLSRSRPGDELNALDVQRPALQIERRLLRVQARVIQKRNRSGAIQQREHVEDDPLTRRANRELLQEPVPFSQEIAISLEAIAIGLEAITILGWRPYLLDWRPSLY